MQKATRNTAAMAMIAPQRLWRVTSSEPDSTPALSVMGAGSERSESISHSASSATT